MNYQTQNQKLLIIDTFYFLHRSFHAYPHSLLTSKGETINMVFGFTKYVVELIITQQPTHLAFAWETINQPSFRLEIYKDYQINRAFSDPDDEEAFLAQIPRIEELIKNIGACIFQTEGYEGDDIIGTLAKQAPKTIEVIIATADQDMLQLVDKNIKVYRPSRPPYVKSKIFDINAVIDKYGFEPAKMIDYKALRGDPSDNIPGVFGIGDKSAKKLLSRYEDLDDIYKNIEEIKDPIRKKLTQEKDVAYMSRLLATIITNVPITLQVENCNIKNNLNIDHLFSFIEKLEFKSLTKKVKMLSSIYKNSQINELDQLSIF